MDRSSACGQNVFTITCSMQSISLGTLLSVASPFGLISFSEGTLPVSLMLGVMRDGARGSLFTGCKHFLQWGFRVTLPFSHVPLKLFFLPLI